VFINDMKERYPVEEHLHGCDGDVDPTTPVRADSDEGDDSGSDSDSDSDSESADDDEKAPSGKSTDDEKSTNKNKTASSSSQERNVLLPKPNKPPPTTPPESDEEQSETPKRGQKRKKSPKKIVPDLSKNSRKKPKNPASPVEKASDGSPYSPTSTDDDEDRPVRVPIGPGAQPLTSAQRRGQPSPIQVAHTPPNETSASVVPTLLNFQIERMTDLVLGCTHAPSAAHLLRDFDKRVLGEIWITTRRVLSLLTSRVGKDAAVLVWTFIKVRSFSYSILSLYLSLSLIYYNASPCHYQYLLYRPRHRVEANLLPPATLRTWTSTERSKLSNIPRNP